MSRTLCLLSAILVLALAACGKSEENKSPEDKPATDPGVSNDKPADTVKPAAEAPAKVDDALMGELKKIAEACQVNTSGVTVTKCPNNEVKTFVDSWKTRDRGAALDTFTAALSGSDDKIKTVAVNLSGKVFARFGDNPKVDPAAAKRYIAAVGKLEKYHAAQSVITATHAAMAADVGDELYAMLDGHSYKPVRGMAYREVMTLGRLKPLDKLMAIAKAEDGKVAGAALAAPRRMYKATDDEKKATCPWIKEYMTSADTEEYKHASHSAIWCRGEYIDALLDEGEKRLGENKFDRDSYLIFRDICFTPMGNKVAGTPEQCERNYKFLEAAVKNDKLEGSARGLALFAIYYQRRDAKTMKVVKKYKNSKVPEIKKYANDAIKSLKETYKVK